MRRDSRRVRVGDIYMGGGAPVSVQSMLNAPASDVEANVLQAGRLAGAGCEIIRVSLPAREDVRLVGALKAAVDVPIVADIHYDWRIALEAVRAGADKIRLNPGNIGGEERVRAVAGACRERGAAIRVGVNGGSLERDLLEKHGGVTPEALVESALRHVSYLERADFFDTVISIKASSVPVNVEAYRLLAERCDYPLHLGVTEAGTARLGTVKNAVGIGALLLCGIGDTLRVSLTADPLREVRCGFDILRAAGLAAGGAEVISCPTCGRTCIPVERMAEELQERLEGCARPLKVAVMGCVVNGLGEGRQADIGIAGAKSGAVLFARGRRLRTLRGDYMGELLREVERIVNGQE